MADTIRDAIAACLAGEITVDGDYSAAERLLVDLFQSRTFAAFTSGYRDGVYAITGGKWDIDESDIAKDIESAWKEYRDAV